MGGLCSKDLNFPTVLREGFLKATLGVRAAECMIFFWLVGSEVTGWCSRNIINLLVLTNWFGIY